MFNNIFNRNFWLCTLRLLLCYLSKIKFVFFLFLHEIIILKWNELHLIQEEIDTWGNSLYFWASYLQRSLLGNFFLFQCCWLLCFWDLLPDLICLLSKEVLFLNFLVILPFYKVKQVSFADFNFFFWNNILFIVWRYWILKF